MFFVVTNRVKIILLCLLGAFGGTSWGKGATLSIGKTGFETLLPMYYIKTRINRIALRGNPDFISRILTSKECNFVFSIVFLMETCPMNLLF